MLNFKAIRSLLWLPFALLLGLELFQEGVVAAVASFSELNAEYKWMAEASRYVALFLVLPVFDIYLIRYLLDKLEVMVPRESLGQVLRSKSLIFWRYTLNVWIGTTLCALLFFVPSIFYLGRRMFFNFTIAMNRSTDAFGDSHYIAKRWPRKAYIIAAASLLLLPLLSSGLKKLNLPSNGALAITIVLESAVSTLLYAVQVLIYKEFLDGEVEILEEVANG